MIDRERFERLQAEVLSRVAEAEASPRLGTSAAPLADELFAPWSPAHDALHVRRVMTSARRIAEAEGADVDVAVTAALLHELFNYPKHHPDSSKSGDVCAVQAAALLAEHGFDDELVARVAYCIRVHAFSRGIVPETLEAKVLQDADRLDAIGAIGIARLFATSAETKRPFYAIEDPFCRVHQPDDKQWALDHFYKKLLRIGDGLHTATARALATERITFMRAYLDQLERELK